MITADSVVISKAGLADQQLLFDLCRKSYAENFAMHWNEGGLAWYLDKVFGWEAFALDLINPDINYFIAKVNEEPAGFMKLNLNSNLPGCPSGNGMEVDKIYFRLPFKGRGIGRQLMDVAVWEAKSLNKEFIWLGVIDTNTNAIEFYKKIGFEIHSKTVLEMPYFKEELRGMWRMKLVMATAQD